MAKTNAKKEAYKIFVSCGFPYNQPQEDFVSAIEAYLKSHNCEPMTIGRNKFSVLQPVQFAREVITECDGMLVIAFERIRINDGLDKPNSSSQKSLNGHIYPTVWNQIEPSIAYARNVPIFTFVQKGLNRQGMLSDRLEWFALEDELTPALFNTDKFNQYFQDWLFRVEARKLSPKLSNVEPSQIKMGELIALLTPTQLWGIISTAIGILATVATAAYTLGKFFGTP